MTAERIFPPADRWRLVMEAESIRGADRAVLAALAYHADQGTLQAWPSLATLARESGFHVSTTIRALQSLEKRGVITVLVRSTGGLKHSNRYRVNLDKTWSSARGSPDEELSRCATVELLQPATVAQCNENYRSLQLEPSHSATRTEA